MMKPKLALRNAFDGAGELKAYARKNGFSGIDWSFDLASLPETPRAASAWAETINALAPLEVRYHCPFYQVDLGHEDTAQAGAAETLFQNIIRLVSRVNGRYLSIHIGLGRDSTEPLSWDISVGNLTRLVQFGAALNVRVCLENLAWGWTSRPNLFEKLIRRSGAGVTFDIGHALACESVRTLQYAVEDFVTPHPDRVFNAHLYHTEVPGRGHLPPDNIEQIRGRLALLRELHCPWWVVELDPGNGLLHTKALIDSFLAEEDAP
jgi:sugar phosphate isomerase/epimerase